MDNKVKIARVFPRKTKASPDDRHAYFGPPPFWAEYDWINVSVAFTWDIPHAEWLAEQWKHVGPVQIGGPAFNNPSEEFIPGKYLKKGYTITSRGCTNKCWFCSVWKREPVIKELPIHAGNRIQDDNLLACSEEHIRKVFDMLKGQKDVTFDGGLEARIMKSWHLDLLSGINLSQFFMAYDTFDDYEPLIEVSSMILEAGLMSKARCYVLIGYPKDTLQDAEKRLKQCCELGIMPYAMLWTKDGNRDPEWAKFQRRWARPAIMRQWMSPKNKELIFDLQPNMLGWHLNT